jgi:catechol 2,3-dioxygenase-like lactoylglutathione lyase family enzyme
MFDSLDHVIVAVADLRSATERYQALLGRPPSWRGQHPGAGTANALFRLDNTYLELLAPTGEGAVGDRLRERLETEGEGVLGLAFGTSDLAAAVATLRERGVSVSDPQPGHGRDGETGAERRWENAFLTPESSRGPLVFGIQHHSPPDALPLRDPAEPAAAVEALDHVVLMSADLDATRALYGDALGLRLALDRNFEARGTRILFFRVGGATVEIAGPMDGGPDPAAPDRLWGLAYRIPDLDAGVRRVAAAGFDVSEVRAGRKPGTRVCTVRDGTAGVPTLLIEPAAAGGDPPLPGSGREG